LALIIQSTFNIHKFIKAQNTWPKETWRRVISAIIHHFSLTSGTGYIFSSPLTPPQDVLKKHTSLKNNLVQYLQFPCVRFSPNQATSALWRAGGLCGPFYRAISLGTNILESYLQIIADFVLDVVTLVYLIHLGGVCSGICIRRGDCCSAYNWESL